LLVLPQEDTALRQMLPSQTGPKAEIIAHSWRITYMWSTTPCI